MAETEEFLGELRLGRQLSTIGQVTAIGLVVFVGLLFLLGGRLRTVVGTAEPSAGALATVLLGLSLLNVFELLGGSGERGGTYDLVHETLGGLGGFLTGWCLLGSALALVVALARSTADHILLLLPGRDVTSGFVALGLLSALILVQIFRLYPRWQLLWPITAVLLLAVALLLLTSLPHASFSQQAGGNAVSSRTLTHTAAWLIVGYVGFEAVLTSRRQIRDPGRQLKPALTTILLAGFLLITLTSVVAASFPHPDDLQDEALMVEVFGGLGSMQGWLAFVVALSALVLAANACLLTAARQIHALSRTGALPRRLRRIRSPFSLPPLLFGAVFSLAVLPSLLAPMSVLLDLSAGFTLLALFILNVAAVQSRRSEPGRRRTFTTPFFPLVPGVAIALGVAFTLALPSEGIAITLLWSLLGIASYLVYARSHMLEAQEGVLVFGRESRPERREGVYRILVPVSAGLERQLTLPLATALAHQLGGEVIPLQVIAIADPLAIEEGRRIARERNTLFQWSTRFASRSGVPTFPITRLARSVPDGILDTVAEEGIDLILLSWSIRPDPRVGQMGRVLDPVIRKATCDVVVLAIHPDRLAEVEAPPTAAEGDSVSGSGPFIDRILVPTAGGPHAPLATRLAMLLAREFKATTSAVYVADPHASAEELAEGQQRIRQTLERMRQQAEALPAVDGQGEALADLPIESRVVTSNSVVEGIAEAGEESDLILIGASEEGLIDQVLFGTLPEQVAWACSKPVVMVKHYRGLRRFWIQRAWASLYEALPTLSLSEQVEVYKQVRRGARPDVDFFIMVGLSAVIATYGLLQDSSAVIIGAMLVAPLFTPILALSLAIVRGDIRLLRLATESALKGVSLAIGIAIVLVALSPLRSVTGEVASRTHPNLFDLAVALASGAAGAYALARKDVAAALPGVAIAAALVPPLGVVGIGLAMGDLHVASGGGLLFTTNLIAIVLAGAVTLLLLGFRPTARGEREARLRWGLTTSMILLVLIAIPLAILFLRAVESSRTRQAIDQILNQQLEMASGLEFIGFTFEEDRSGIDVEATLYARQEVSSTFVDGVQTELQGQLGRPVRLRFVSIQVEEIESSKSQSGLEGR